jgi:hypothetical protein
LFCEAVGLAATLLLLGFKRVVKLLGWECVQATA